jgi:hypothetical protein
MRLQSLAQTPPSWPAMMMGGGLMDPLIRPSVTTKMGPHWGYLQDSVASLKFYQGGGPPDRGIPPTPGPPLAGHDHDRGGGPSTPTPAPISHRKGGSRWGTVPPIRKTCTLWPPTGHDPIPSHRTWGCQKSVFHHKGGRSAFCRKHHGFSVCPRSPLPFASLLSTPVLEWGGCETPPSPWAVPHRKWGHHRGWATLGRC